MITEQPKSGLSVAGEEEKKEFQRPIDYPVPSEDIFCCYDLTRLCNSISRTLFWWTYPTEPNTEVNGGCCPDDSCQCCPSCECPTCDCSGCSECCKECSDICADASICEILCCPCMMCADS